MDRSRYEQLMDLFDEVCDLEAERQQLRLREVMAEDLALAQKLAQLLEHDAKGSDVLPRGMGSDALGQTETPSAVPSDRGSTIGLSAIPRARIVGQRIGNWLVREHLGSGGVGVVHRVEHVEDGRSGAIKLLRHASLSDPNSLKRFRLEFQAVSELDHPGCLKVFEEGQGTTGRHYVMEYVDGGDLRKLIGADTDVLLEVLIKVAEALEYIHARGIVHRDLKPANVLLTRDEPPQPKLADFGIARVEGKSGASTGAGVVGSIDFLAPEQIVGEPIDQRTDLFALGCLVFVLFSGRPPYTGDNFDRMRARLHEPPAPFHLAAPHAPRALVRLVHSLLARKSADRPANASEVLAALRAARRQPSLSDG